MVIKRTPRLRAHIARQGTLVAVGKTPVAAMNNLLRILAIRQGLALEVQK